MDSSKRQPKGGNSRKPAPRRLGALMAEDNAGVGVLQVKSNSQVLSGVLILVLIGYSLTFNNLVFQLAALFLAVAMYLLVFSGSGNADKEFRYD